jgi:hypothetical protein
MSIKEEAVTRHCRQFHIGSSIICGLHPVLSELLRQCERQWQNAANKREVQTVTVCSKQEKYRQTVTVCSKQDRSTDRV